MKIKNVFYMLFLLGAAGSAYVHQVSDNGELFGASHFGEDRRAQMKPGSDFVYEPDINLLPDAVWVDEAKHRTANLSYKVKGKRYYPGGNQTEPEEGIASWYGKQFHGRLTSSGETYNMYEMTAAHKTLPIPSYVKVTNLENNRTVVVRVNDRGPFHANRIIDLSYSAAHKLGFTQKGVAKVRVEQIVPEESKAQIADAAGSATVLSTQKLSAAQDCMDELSNSLKNLSAKSQNVYMEKSNGLYRVMLSPGTVPNKREGGSDLTLLK